MRVLLTGANGFVGSHIAEALIVRGHQPVLMVRMTADLRWLAGMESFVHRGDFTRPDECRRALIGVDAVIHNAGVLRARSVDEYYRVNRDAVAGLADAARAAGSVRKIVLISSQAAMGPADGASPRAIADSERPVSDYGRSKLAGESALKEHARGIPYTILRPSSVYGPRDRDILGFFKAVHYGLHPVCSDNRRFQLVFVSDLAAAAVAALEPGSTDMATYYLAADETFTWEQAARTIAQAIGVRTIGVPLPNAALRAAGLCAESIAALFGNAAVLNRQKVDELLQTDWTSEHGPAAADLGIVFTKFSIGAKMTYLWYRANHWL